MAEIQKSIELSVQEYVASIGLNPDNVYYQRIASTNVNTRQAQWQIISPNKRALLMAGAWIDWKPTITRQTDAGVAEAFINNGVFASFKPGLPFANAMSNIQITLNSASLSISQPRRFMDHLSMMFAGRRGAKKGLATAGGEFWGLNGYNTDVLATNGLYTGWLRPDESLLNNEEKFREKLIRTAGAVTLNGTNGHQISCLEPLMIPPFNPFYKIKAGMPDYCWFKHMSAMIPHVSRLEITCNFQNLAPSVLFPRHIRQADGALRRLDISDLAADLVLYWYNPPLTMTLPRQVTLNTWSVREYVTSIVGVAGPPAVQNNETIDNINTDLLQLHSVPSLIVIHAEVDKDSVNYTNQGFCSSDQANGNGVNSVANNSLDSYMEISNFEVTLGDRPQVINSVITQEELYNITLKNSKIKDFPYTFEQWRGQLIPRPVVGATAYNQSSKCFIALRSKDISERFGDGVRFPTSLQFKMSLTARDGLANLAGGGNNAHKRYRLFVHIYTGKHFLALTPDSGQFQEQQIDLNAASQTQQVQTGAGLSRVKVDDTRYHSRMPTL
ncbi:MAG: hypothetical protein GY756_17290 [bacterium]|nr:hypothetical protein [bacterium]